MYADSRRTHRRRLIVAAALGAALLGAGALIVTTSNEPAGDPPRGTPTTIAPSASPLAIATGALADRSDPRRFAVAAAKEVFAWDTSSAVSTDGYFARLVRIADPGGVESDGLVADLTTYLPTQDAWLELRRYRTRQWLEVTSAEVPSTWAATAREGEAYGLERGTTAYTISGIRHRRGVWGGRPTATQHRVRFTVFIICGPRYPTCYLLRLSRLDRPLP